MPVSRKDFDEGPLFSSVTLVELNQLERFLKEEYGSPGGRFALSPNWRLSYLQNGDVDGELIRFKVVETESDKTVTIEIRPSDFPSRSDDDADSPMSPRIFDMTSSIERFLSLVNLDSVQSDQAFRVSE
jgi:hypothetical protein